MARTSKKMYPLVEQWEESGKSKVAFCKEKRLNPHVFNYWLKKYRKSKAKSKEDQTMDFVELQVEQSQFVDQPRILAKSPTIFAEIDYPNGVALRLHHPISSSALQNLLQSFS